MPLRSAFHNVNKCVQQDFPIFRTSAIKSRDTNRGQIRGKCLRSYSLASLPASSNQSHIRLKLRNTTQPGEFGASKAAIGDPLILPTQNNMSNTLIAPNVFPPDGSGSSEGFVRWVDGQESECLQRREYKWTPLVGWWRLQILFVWFLSTRTIREYQDRFGALLQDTRWTYEGSLQTEQTMWQNGLWRRICSLS